MPVLKSNIANTGIGSPYGQAAAGHLDAELAEAAPILLVVPIVRLAFPRIAGKQAGHSTAGEAQWLRNARVGPGQGGLLLALPVERRAPSSRLHDLSLGSANYFSVRTFDLTAPVHGRGRIVRTSCFQAARLKQAAITSVKRCGPRFEETEKGMRLSTTRGAGIAVTALTPR